jgi:transposase
VRTLVERLRTIGPQLIVPEATGGYELLSVAALAAAVLPVVVVNPRQVRDFAKATGQLAKTGRIDADKPKKLALVACMRKLRTILNTMVRKHERWNADAASGMLTTA